MNKTATITNTIALMPYSEEYSKRLKDNTTYNIIDDYLTKMHGSVRGKTVKTYTNLHGGKISLPIGCLDLVDRDIYAINDLRTLSPVNFPKPKLQLRESQQEICDNVEDNCMINAPVGWGKTFTALFIAAKLGQKTLILTHTTILRDQWAQEVEKLFNIQPGIIGGGDIVDIDKPIVIANSQTLVKHINKFRSMFGTLIVDECHHIPSTTFSNIVGKFTSRYKIGLSGTLLRRDKQEVLFKDYFSSKIYKPVIENVLIPSVYLVGCGVGIPHGQHWADRVTNLCAIPEYKNFILKLATTMAKRDYKVLVVADRVEFLKDLHSNSDSLSVCITSEVTGQERFEAIDKIKTGQAKILYGTRSIFSEGVSVDELSCLVLANPIANNINLTQLIGRIQRMKDGKKTPAIIDPQLQDSSSIRQAKNRIEHYMNMGYKVYSVDKFLS